ncbi:hypothetical protein BLNAU_9538 [Blattamonas nauphoetae]|uniref:Uncharacterized protein n=1 Tax=Blattamonas nauphoetae TaxID=2049346 RepID=A0ABQ9XVH8_9EUKA|nr:hypothetical protein BLNAU_9538 [Blattamonas nauphoetae]
MSTGSLVAMIWTVPEGARYTLVKTETSTVFVDSELQFQLRPAVSRIVSLGDLTRGEDLNTTTLQFVGERMSSGTYRLTFLDSTHFQQTGEEHFVETQIVFMSATEGTMMIDLYPTPQLMYGHTYTIESFTTSESVTEKVINHIVTLTAPTEPSRLERIAQVDYLDDEKVLRLSWEGRLMTNGPYTVTLSVNGTSTTTPLLLVFDDGSTATTAQTLFGTWSGSLKYNTAYVVIRVKDEVDQAVIFNSGITFTTISEPTRLLSLSGPVNTDGLNSTILTLTGHQVPAGDATLTVVLSSIPSGSETESDKIALPVSFTRSGDDTTGTVLIPLNPTPALAFDQTYRIVSLSSAKYIDTLLAFTMPSEPTRLEKVTGILSDDAKQVTLQFEGRVLDSGEYEVTLQTAGSSTEMVVHLIRQGDGTLSCSISTEETNTPHVIFGQTYTITQMTKDSTPIIINPSAMKITVPFPPPPEICVVVDRTGSGTVEECGGRDKPCDSIGVGWEVGVRRDGEEGQAVVVKVRREVVFGGSVTVRGGTLRICSESSAMRRIIAEGALDEDEESGKGLVNVVGGRVEMDEVLLVLPISSSLDLGRAVSVIWGRGEVRLSSVEIVQKESGRVGMGVVCVESGVVEMKRVKAANVWMEDGVALLRVESGVKSVRMEIEGCEFSDIHTLRSPLLSFSSRSPSSSMRLSTSSFVNVVSTLSPSTPPLSIATCQAVLTMSECMFTKCGLFSAAGIASGPTMSFTLSSPTPLLTLSSCVFTGSFPSSTVSGCVLISSSSLARIDLVNTRFVNSESSEMCDSTAFLNWNTSTRFSVDSASITFHSLVTLVKEGYPFDDALEAKAIGFLGQIDTHFKRSEDANLLFSLVPAHDDPVNGFLDALLSLLASSMHTIVESALEILQSLFRLCSTGNIIKMLNCDVISGVMNIIQPHTLSLSLRKSLHVQIMDFLTSVLCASDRPPSRNIDDATQTYQMNEMIFQRIIVPSDGYVRYLCSNRYFVSEHLSAFTLRVISCKLIKLFLFHSPTCNFPLSLPIALTITSLSTSFNPNFVTTFLDSFVPMMRAWRIADPHTVGKGKTIIRALNDEGFDDGLDQTLFKVKPEYHRYGSPSIDHFAWPVKLCPVEVGLSSPMSSLLFGR